MALATHTPPENFVTRFRRHLPRSNDPILIVLKGHLLREEVLDGLIFEQLMNPAALEQVRLTLFERLRLARALVAPGVLDDLLDSAEKLNTLRNRIAHHLEPPQLERHVAEFPRLLEDPEVPGCRL